MTLRMRSASDSPMRPALGLETALFFSIERSTIVTDVVLCYIAGAVEAACGTRELECPKGARNSSAFLHSSHSAPSLVDHGP